MLLDRGYDLVGCVNGSCIKLCKKGETLSIKDVEDYLQGFTLYQTSIMDQVLEAHVPSAKDRSSFVQHLPEGQKLGVYLTNDQSNMGKAPILAIIADALEKKMSRIIVPLAHSYTCHATKEIANAKAEHGLIVEIFAYNELYVPLATHETSPTYVVLTEEEIAGHLKEYKLEDRYQLPRIEEGDPQARYYGLSTGLVIRVHRPSLYYRVVIPSC
jgi:DNA-directed RNA polymerase I, II, and III subunit RPABC1